MPALAKQASDDKKPVLTPATVVAVSRNRVMVSREKQRPFAATLAIAGGYLPHVGDRVLVGAGAKSEVYVVGVLTALRAAEAPAAEVGGATAAREMRGDAEVLVVRDAQGGLLFEHRPSEGKSVVYAPVGDLEFRADAGSVTLLARDGVRIEGERQIVLTSAEGVKLEQRATDADKPSTVAVDARGVRVETPRIDARAARADAVIGDARLVARSLQTAVETARTVAGVLETEATRIVERARNAYREVTELSQTRAGRMRLVAEATFHLFGKRTLVKGEDDVKLKGKKIYLA